MCAEAPTVDGVLVESICVGFVVVIGNKNSSVGGPVLPEDPGDAGGETSNILQLLLLGLVRVTQLGNLQQASYTTLLLHYNTASCTFVFFVIFVFLVFLFCKLGNLYFIVYFILIVIPL